MKEILLGGLCFVPVKSFNPKVYISIHKWIEAGKPGDCYVYDTIDALNISGIPICDAKVVNGMYVKVAILPKQPVDIKKLVLKIGVFSRMTKCEAKVNLDIIQHSNTKDHHKMNYV